MNENELKPGDIIWADRSVKGLPYNHCGIYEGGGHVIHFASPEGSETSQETAVVHETTFEHFKDDCPVKVIDIKGSYPAETTLRRARECIGMKGYDFTSFNCDHFATWCKTGVYHSLQVDKVKTVLKELDNPLAEIVCEMHDMEEKIKASRLDAVYPQGENQIADTIETNSLITETIPPVPDEENDIKADFEIMENEPCPEDEAKEADKNEIIEREDDADEDNAGEDEGGEGQPPAKKPWYEKVGNVLKGITYPVSIAFEFLRRIKLIPIPVNFLHIGAKVRNVIDNIVTNIKVFTGRLTPEQAVEERKNNETALAGLVIAEKQNQPVKERLKQTFGVIGSKVKHIVHQVVTRVVPAPVRNVIKAGAKIIGTKIATGVKTFFQKAVPVVKGLFAGFKKVFTGH